MDKMVSLTKRAGAKLAGELKSSDSPPSKSSQTLEDVDHKYVSSEGDASGKLKSAYSLPLDEDEYDGDVNTSVFPRGKLEDGVIVAKMRAKELSHAVQRFQTYLEKKIEVDEEAAKQKVKLSKELTEGFSKEEFKGNGTYSKGISELIRRNDYISQFLNKYLEDCQHQILDPLNILKKEHEKTRKQLWERYLASQKRLQETVASLEKVKATYDSYAARWNKTLAEKMKEEISSYKVNIEKKTKEEEEAHAKVDSAQKQYEEQIRVANATLQIFLRECQYVLSDFEKLIQENEDSLRKYLIQYTELETSFFSSVPPQIQYVHEFLKNINDTEDLHNFVQKKTSNKLDQSVPFMFQKYPLDEDVEKYIGGKIKTEVQKGLHEFVKSGQPFKCAYCKIICLQGIECKLCETRVHPKCAEKLKNDCSAKASDKANDTNLNLCVFGSPLENQPLTNDSAPVKIPYIVYKCITEVEKRGMQEEGIYRLSGIKSAVESMVNLFEERGHTDKEIDLSKELDINVVSNCLKGFFRKLPEPLVPNKLYDALISLAQNEIIIPAFSGILMDFPKLNFDVFSFLFAHLKKVSELQEVNKMKPYNLAVVFGPSLMRSPDDQIDGLHNPLKIKIVETFIIHYDEIFGTISRKDTPKNIEENTSESNTPRSSEDQPPLLESNIETTKQKGLETPTPEKSIDQKIPEQKTPKDYNLEAQENLKENLKEYKMENKFGSRAIRKKDRKVISDEDDVDLDIIMTRRALEQRKKEGSFERPQEVEKQVVPEKEKEKEREEKEKEIKIEKDHDIEKEKEDEDNISEEKSKEKKKKKKSEKESSDHTSKEEKEKEKEKKKKKN